MERHSLEIEGMTCGHCVGGVTRALQGLEGVEVEAVQIGSATVLVDPERVDREEIGRAIEDAGYRLGPEVRVS